MPRSVLHIEALALTLGFANVTDEEARRWVFTHRDEPIDQLSVMLMAQGYGADNCDEEHDTSDGSCDCYTELNDSDVWELDERPGKPVVEFAGWWGPYQLWESG